MINTFHQQILQPNKNILNYQACQNNHFQNVLTDTTNQQIKLQSLKDGWPVVGIFYSGLCFQMLTIWGKWYANIKNIHEWTDNQPSSGRLNNQGASHMKYS